MLFCGKFDEYRTNPFSKNHESHKKFRAEFRAMMKSEFAKLFSEEKEYEQIKKKQLQDEDRRQTTGAQ